MPTPAGHALGGLAAAFLVASATRAPLTVGVVTAAPLLAVCPDLDLIVGSHRTVTHSVGAVAIVWTLSWLVLRKHHRAVSSASVLAAAYGSHLVLDWLGKDSSSPPGLQMFWPLSDAFFISNANLFMEVSRRYWRPGEFLFGNALALAWECALLLPLAIVIWSRWSRITLR